MLKRILAATVLNSIALFSASAVITGLSYSSNLKVLLASAATLSLVNFFVRPLVKLVMLPVNIITLGAFSWLVNAFMLYLTTFIVKGLTVTSFSFSGYTYGGFVIPAAHLSVFWTIVAASFLISLVYNTTAWIFK